MKIAEVKGLYFDVPKGSYFSFFNSPYPAHRLGTAVDVYFQEKALFPFEEGRVLEVREIRTPTHVPAQRDYLIAIEVPPFCLKVLHVKPAVRPGEKLGLHDELGEMVVSGFFMPWSDRHAHFELRTCEDRYRARGALPLKPLPKKLVGVSDGQEFEVTESNPEYCWLKPLRTRGKGLTPLKSGSFALEGGLPHYGYGAVFGVQDTVRLFGLEIRTKEKLPLEVSIFESDFRVLANGREMKGIGIYCNQGRIKLIGGKFGEGDTVRISFIS